MRLPVSKRVFRGDFWLFQDNFHVRACKSCLEPEGVDARDDPAGDRAVGTRAAAVEGCGSI